MDGRAESSPVERRTAEAASRRVLDGVLVKQVRNVPRVVSVSARRRLAGCQIARPTTVPWERHFFTTLVNPSPGRSAEPARHLARLDPST